jgi:hypothetical protein
MDAREEPGARLTVPIVATEALDGPPAQPVVDATVLDRENAALVRLAGALSPYAQGLAELDPADRELAEQAGYLRALIEAAYGQRFTFRGERRDPTGTRVTVTQVLHDVGGTVVGADADVAAGGDVAVHQEATTIQPGGSVTGFKGRLGR